MASKVGGGATPGATTQFFASTVSVTVTDPSQRILVVALAEFGSSSAAPASGLNLFICYQQSGGAVTPVGNGLVDLHVPAFTKVTQGLTTVLQLPPGTYSVGMCGTGGNGWDANPWGTTSALVL
jgi:hypothetical protein